MLKLIRKFRILPILLVAVIVCLVLAHPAFAVEPTIAGEASKINWLTPLAGLFSIILILIALLSIIIAVLLGDLMTSTYIFDTGMGDTLHLVWEIMRNFVNVVFIIALLIIAVRVIFGIGESGGTGFLKKILPKFIIALIAVNLTFFGARFIIGTADVLATAVFALPKSVVGEKMVRGVPCPDTYKEFQTSRIWEAEKCSKEVQKVMLNGASDKKLADKAVGEFGNMIKNVSNATSVNVKIQSLLAKENFALVLLMNILRLDDLLWLKSVTGDFQTFIVGSIGSVIMAGAVGVVYFMLFIAFLIRVVVLWIMIPLMPIGVLAMVMKDVIPGMPDGGSGTFSLTGFIKTAFMPVFVAFPLSIGMIMIFGNNSISTLDGVSIVSMDTFTKHFNVILWWAASIGVVWYGTNEAIKMGNEMAGKFTESIHNKVNGAVGAVASTAKYAPIIPGFGGSVNELMGAPMAAINKIKSASESRKEAMGEGMAHLLPKGWTAGAPLSKDGIDSRLKDAATSDAAEKDASKKGSIMIEKLKDIANGNNRNTMENGSIGSDLASKLSKAYGVPVNANQTYLAALKEIAERSRVIEGSKKNEIKDLIKRIEEKDEASTSASTTAPTTPPATPTGTPVAGAGINDTVKVYADGTNRVIVSGTTTHDLSQLAGKLSADSNADTVKAVAKELHEATKLLAKPEDKHHWEDELMHKLAGSQKKILEDTLKDLRK
ncbi:MAG: hypothetical protein PHY86_00765 [Candidatus Gracilibacteria bacterium]|nr:hypothetical protein [Candidatus Gracilibacteria bacterium]